MPDNPFAPENLNKEGYPVKEAKEMVVYSGRCRRESSSNIRTFSKGNTTVGSVVYVNYRVSMPGKIKIHRGDIIDVDYDIGSDKGMTVLHPNYSALKTPRTPDGCTECFYNLTEI